jgi:hypothetical protein
LQLEQLNRVSVEFDDGCYALTETYGWGAA